jgi:alpha-tubulin suppressor-like RCC1 family protein
MGEVGCHPSLRTTDEAWCWGRNTSGQLGDGTTTRRLSPVKVSGGFPLASIVAGFGHTCGVTRSNDAYCWGLNDRGQLGIGATFATRLVPTHTWNDTRFVFSGISVGSVGFHTCGLSTDRLVYCWGWNSAGQLGSGSHPDYYLPWPVSGQT